MEFIKNDIENNEKSKEVKTKSNNKKRIFSGIFLGLLCGIGIFVAGEIFIGGGINGKNLHADVTSYCVINSLGRSDSSNRTLVYSATCNGNVTIIDTQYKTDSTDWTSRGNGPGSYTSKTGSIVFRSSLVGKNVYLRLKYKINNAKTVAYTSEASVVLGQNKVFNQVPTPYVTTTYDSRATMNNEIGIVKSYGVYKNAYIFNTKQKYYYRWFAYKGNNTSTELNYRTDCRYVGNDSKINASLTVASSIPDRLVNLRIYNNKSECDIDTSGTSSKFLSESSMRYKYQDPNVVTVPAGFTTMYDSRQKLNYTVLSSYTRTNDMYHQEQYGNNCFCYALAYAKKMITNSDTSGYNSKGCSNTSSTYGFTSSYFTNTKETINFAANKILKEKQPVVLHVSGTPSGHFLVAFGIESSKFNSYVQTGKVPTIEEKDIYLLDIYPNSSSTRFFPLTVRVPYYSTKYNYYFSVEKYFQVIYKN